MSYSKVVSTEHPFMVLILKDDSTSMDEILKSGISKADFAAGSTNMAINENVSACIRGNEIRDRCYVAVVGYGSDVKVRVKGKASELAAQSENLPMYSFKNPSSGVTIEVPQWVKSKSGGTTPMALAFKEAKKILEQWIQKFPNSFPPIVINITDGQPNSLSDTTKAIEKIKPLGTTDGKVLIFNAFVEKMQGGSSMFPTPQDTLPSQYAKFLFDNSSVIPTSLIQYGKEFGLNIRPNSRGMIINDNVDALIKFIQFGSTASQASQAVNQAARIPE